MPTDRHLDLTGAAGGSCHLFKAAHDIDMRQSPPAILAALDRGDMPTVKADQQQRGRRGIAARTQLDPRLVVNENERDQTQKPGEDNDEPKA